jgi:hypothetical protein
MNLGEFVGEVRLALEDTSGSPLFSDDYLKYTVRAGLHWLANYFPQDLELSVAGNVGERQWALDGRVAHRGVRRVEFPAGSGRYIAAAYEGQPESEQGFETRFVDDAPVLYLRQPLKEAGTLRVEADGGYIRPVANSDPVAIPATLEPLLQHFTCKAALATLRYRYEKLNPTLAEQFAARTNMYDERLRETLAALRGRRVGMAILGAE